MSASIQQIPPPFSAKKIKGVPAYKLARKKQEVELQPVEVEVKEFTVLEPEGDLVEFRCRVSSGTYVRSLAHELGQKLGIGAHLASLRRTAVAEFAIEQSHTLERDRARPPPKAVSRSCWSIRGGCCRRSRR